jgi:hypothetical protein
MTRARDLASLGDNTTKLEQQGLVQVIPTSVTVGSGSGSVNSKGTISLSGVSSAKINGCFSSTYDNYKITVAGLNTATTGVAGISFRFVKSTVESTSNYFYTFIYAGNSGGPSRTYAGSQSIWSAGALGDYESSVIWDIIEPFKAASRTNYYGNYTGVASTNNEMGIVNGFHTLTDSYDGFSFSCGTFTGTIRVYGYNQ